MSRIRFFIVPAFTAAVFAFASVASAQDASVDPPDRVARLAYSTGDVEIAPAGQNDWGSVDVNRPLVTGDRLLSGDDGRAALELGNASLRIDHGSAFNFLELNDTTAQVELSQGALNLRVRDVGNGQTYEVDTPTVAFIATQPGAYRIDIAPDGHGAMVTVFDGSGTVYGANGASRPVSAGQSYRFDDSSLANVAATVLPSPDDFDRFCEERDNRWQNSVSRRYVSPDVIGYDDLDGYGNWQANSDYGDVWYPTQVYAGWAPYRDGHWVWINPWGWTWVDNAPWGFAPFHYGRWVYVGNRWGWCPGPRMVSPVYAPALVAFVGGSGFSLSINLGGGGPVGWFPLGPRDIYVPPYRASRNYFTNINVTNIRNVYVNQTVINNYYGNYAAGRPMNEARYVYRGNPSAFTAVPRNVFTGAKPVRTAALHVPAREIAQASVMTTGPRIAPTQASLAIRPPARPIATPARAFDRTVVAKNAPPPRPVPFATQERVIAKQGGAPIPMTQLHEMREQQAKLQPQPSRVQVVPVKPTATAALPPVQHAQPQQPQQPRVPVRQPTSTSPQGQARITPIQAPVHPAPAAQQAAPTRPGELPSARFAHPDRDANSPTSRTQQNQQPLNVQQQQPSQSQSRAQQQQVQQRQDQDQMRKQQDQQRTEQAKMQQQQAQQQQAQQRQYQDQMRKQQDQQHAQQVKMQQQQAQQQQAQQQAQQRQYQDQMRAQQEQQHAEQVQMQQQDQHQAQMQQQQHAQPQHVPPPPKPKPKDQDQQDNSGH